MSPDLAVIRDRLGQAAREIGDTYKATPAGMWACSDAEEVHDLFGQIDLASCHHLLDLGSGDGRVVMVASLFTRASGVEADPDLVERSRRTAGELGLERAKFLLGDCREIDLGPYDLLFVYPDKPLAWLEERLPPDWPGRLLVYGNYFRPRTMRHLKTLYAGGTTCSLWAAGDVVGK